MTEKGKQGILLKTTYFIHLHKSVSLNQKHCIMYYHHYTIRIVQRYGKAYINALLPVNNTPCVFYFFPICLNLPDIKTDKLICSWNLITSIFSLCHKKLLHVFRKGQILDTLFFYTLGQGGAASQNVNS